MKLSGELQAEPYQSRFKKDGRVHIPNLLTPDAAHEIYESLCQQEKWNLVFNQKGKHVDINADSESLWTQEQKADFLGIVHSQATNDFQYLYRSIPIYDIYHQKLLPGSFLNKIFEFLNGEAFLGYLRATLDMPEIGFADAQATCFLPGHFLTSHDDNVAGKNRLAAYILNLTPAWNTNWGGALQFIDQNGGIKEAFSPTYNALNILKVPQQHSVAYVAPFAGAPRYAITGWLRVGQDPAPA